MQILQNDHHYGLLTDHDKLCYFISKGTQIPKFHIFEGIFNKYFIKQHECSKYNGFTLLLLLCTTSKIQCPYLLLICTCSTCLCRHATVVSYFVLRCHLFFIRCNKSIYLCISCVVISYCISKNRFT